VSATSAIGLVVLALVALVVQLADRRIRRGARQQGTGARWASRRELKALAVDGPRPGRITLGYHRRQLLAAEPHASVIVFAPTQTYKTRRLAMPAVRDWQGPVLAVSMKPDLMRETIAAREALGEVMVFDPSGGTGLGTVRASPLTGCGTWGATLRTTRSLVSAAKVSSASFQDGGFWYSAAERLIAPLLFAAAASGGSMVEVIRWLNEVEGAMVKVGSLLDEAEDKDAIGAWKANLNRDPRQRSSIYTTAETILIAFSDPEVQKATIEPNFIAADLLNANATLYLYGPQSEQDRLRPLFSTMIDNVVRVVDESFEVSEKALDPGLLIVLDEAANIAPPPNYDSLAATGVGKGIKLLSILQDLSQLRQRYGPAAQTIVNNHWTKLIGGANGDVETLDYITKLIGPAEFEHFSETISDGKRSRTEGGAYRDLAPAAAIRGTARGDMLLVAGAMNPAMITLVPEASERSGSR
jgi:type IV secretion system protein VirD4